MEKEHKKVVERKQGEIRRLQKLCEKTAIAYEQMHEKYLEQLHLRYAAESALEEEKGKNQKLRCYARFYLKVPFFAPALC